MQLAIAAVHARFRATGYNPYMVAQKFAFVVLALILLGLLSLAPADAEQRMRCLSRDQQRSAITDRRAVPLAAVRRSVRGRVPGELVRAQLCQDPQRLIYLLTVLQRDGKVRHVTIDARTSAVVTLR